MAKKKNGAAQQQVSPELLGHIIRKKKKKSKNKRRREAKQRRERAVRDLLMQYDLSGLIEQAKRLNRHFVLHIGETNSGKTYHALQALKKAETGVYLGPLRLLALEVFDRLNLDGCPCTLRTGEEYEPVPFAQHTASTIELCDCALEYDVAVIDEAQLAADPYRGAAWTRALFGVRAKEVHICLAPEAEQIICHLLDSIHAEYETIFHERLVPLAFSGTAKGLDAVEPGDALITFSRQTVLSTAAALEQRGISASVIYGALPPASRREEVRKFASGENTVVVATDAIGMGISLPIRRVIFCQTTKFDGISRRDLTVSEIKQIAGRAGRYGMYDIGEVLTMSDPERIAGALANRPPAVTGLTVPFPTEVLDAGYDIPTLFKAWESLPPLENIRRAELSDALLLYHALGPAADEAGIDRRTVYRYITCPVDTRSPALVEYWRDCAISLMYGGTAPAVPFEDDSLENCELRYKALDVRHQMLHRAGVEECVSREQQALSRKISEFLKADKSGFLRRCYRCYDVLPFGHRYRVCERCFQKISARREQKRLAGTEISPEETGG